MYKRRLVWIIIVAVVFATAFTACNRINQNDTIDVSGELEVTFDISDIEILINGEPLDGASVNDDRTFFVNGIKNGDVISFYKEGYIFDTYTAKKSIRGIIITGGPASLTVNVGVNELGSVTGGGNYSYGDSVTLNFTAGGHAKFDGLYLDNVLVSENPSYTFTVESNCDFEARFSRILYPIEFTKSHNEGTAQCSNSAAFGDSVTLDAEDNEHYVFSHWTVNGMNIEDKHYVFALDTTTPVVTAHFLARLNMPVISVYDNIITVDRIENADRYIFCINGVQMQSSGKNTYDLNAADLLSGNYSVTVKAEGAGQGESFTSEQTVQYRRPLDTPKSYGIIQENGIVYYTFSRVLGADGYTLYINGAAENVDTLAHSVTGSAVRVDLSDVLLDSGTYVFTVIAKGSGDSVDSMPTAEISYDYTATLDVPVVTLQGGVLVWSHIKDGVTFDIIVGGVTVMADAEEGSLDLSTVVDGDSAAIKVIAKLAGYKYSEYNTEYIK